MSLYKSEIMGTVNTLLRYSQLVEKAMLEGWEDEDTMLTGTQVSYVHRALAEAKKVLGRAQEHFKKFEAVADARKIATGV